MPPIPPIPPIPPSIPGAAVPFYNEDLEAENRPPAVVDLLDAIDGADVLLFATPEYNHSVPGVLKNAIDWASRPAEGEGPLAAYRGKVAGLLAASPGGLGGTQGAFERIGSGNDFHRVSSCQMPVSRIGADPRFQPVNPRPRLQP